MPTAVPGTGRVDTYRINYQAWAPGLETPLVIARVALDGVPGAYLTANIVNCAPEAVVLDQEITSASGAGRPAPAAAVPRRVHLA